MIPTYFYLKRNIAIDWMVITCISKLQNLIQGLSLLKVFLPAQHAVWRVYLPIWETTIPVPSSNAKGGNESLGHDCFLCLVSPPPLLPTPCNLERSTCTCQLFWTTTRQVIETRTLLGHDQLSVHPKYRMFFNQPSQFSRPKRKSGSQIKSSNAAAVRTSKLTKRFFLF